MTVQDHDAIEELLPAYALGSLEAAEAVAVESHLDSCPDCRASLAGFQLMVADLALAAPEVTPGPGVRLQLLERVSASSGRVSQPPAATGGWRRRLRAFLTRPRPATAWQPGLILLLLFLLAGNIWLWTQNQAGPTVAAPATPLLPFTTLVMTGTDLAPEAVGIIYISDDGAHGTLIVEGLPDLPESQQYQLWLIKDGQRSDGGVFSVTPDGYSSLWIRAPLPLDQYPAFGITIEPAGGSPQPTGDRVLGYNL